MRNSPILDDGFHHSWLYILIPNEYNNLCQTKISFVVVHISFWYTLVASIELKRNKKIKSQQKIELIFCSHQNAWSTIGLYTRQTVLLSIEIILNPQTLKLSHGRETRRMSYSRHSRSPPKLMFLSSHLKSLHNM